MGHVLIVVAGRMRTSEMGRLTGERHMSDLPATYDVLPRRTEPMLRATGGRAQSEQLISAPSHLARLSVPAHLTRSTAELGPFTLASFVGAVLLPEPSHARLHDAAADERLVLRSSTRSLRQETFPMGWDGELMSKICAVGLTTTRERIIYDRSLGGQHASIKPVE
jgi:hypothetical protein